MNFIFRLSATIIILLFSFQSYAADTIDAIIFGEDIVDNSSPLIADIRPDFAGKEIVIGNVDGYLYLFTAWGGQIFRFDAGVGIDSSPAAADLNNDGYLEIVFTSGSLDSKRKNHGGIFVIDRFGNIVWKYNYENAIPAGEFGGPSLPYKIPQSLNFGDLNDGIAEYMESSPAIADVDNDMNYEIFAGCMDHNFYGFNHDGTILDSRTDDDGDGRINEDPGFIRTDFGGIDNDGDAGKNCNTLSGKCIDEDPPDWPINNQDTIFSSAALGDIDADGVMEIIFGGDSTGAVASYCPDGGKLWFLKPGGSSQRKNNSPLPIGSTTMPNGNVLCKGQIFASSPALADTNNDGYLEIFTGTGNFSLYLSNPDTNRVFGFNYLGEILPGFPYECGANQVTKSSVAIGDINGDGKLDLVICSGDMGGTNSKIHAIDSSTGKSLPGFPVKPFDQPNVISSPIIADVNGDNKADIVVGINNHVFAYNGFVNS